MSQTQNDTPERPRGRFITLEGIEGAGKSTVLAELEAQLHRRNVQTLSTREPGGTGIAEAIRELVLERHEDEVLRPRAELLLVFAAREQHLAEVIRPALAAGTWVLCDRFTDATLAYQGAGRGLEEARIRELADWLHGDCWPDLTILLDVPEPVGLARARQRSEPDRFEIEKAEFFHRARACYLDLARAEPGRYRVIDATESLASVRTSARAIIDRFLEENLA